MQRSQPGNNELTPEEKQTIVTYWLYRGKPTLALGQAQVVFAGLQSGTPYDHYNIFRCTISAGFYYFSSLESFIMAPDGEDITYEYPDCHFPLVGKDYEETSITLVEKYTGTTAYTRPLICHPARGTAFSDTAFTEPRPFLPAEAFGEGGPAYGLRLSSTNPTNPSLWLSMPSGLWRAPPPRCFAPRHLKRHPLYKSQSISIVSPVSSCRRPRQLQRRLLPTQSTQQTQQTL